MRTAARFHGNHDSVVPPGQVDHLLDIAIVVRNQNLCHRTSSGKIPRHPHTKTQPYWSIQRRLRQRQPERCVSEVKYRVVKKVLANFAIRALRPEENARKRARFSSRPFEHVVKKPDRDDLFSLLLLAARLFLIFRVGAARGLCPSVLLPSAFELDSSAFALVSPDAGAASARAAAAPFASVLAGVKSLPQGTARSRRHAAGRRFTRLRPLCLRPGCRALRPAGAALRPVARFPPCRGSRRHGLHHRRIRRPTSSSAQLRSIPAAQDIRGQYCRLPVPD